MDKGVALYIHIPFCRQKCFYCDFPSFGGKENLMFNYSKALSKEINNIGNRKINTIFIGGGTPTYLSLEALLVIKESIDKLNKDENLEFTVEGNPGSFNEKNLKLFKEMGVNRLSIGLQAWQDSLLKTLGRIHTLNEFKESFTLARNLGFNNINIDLMFGLPNQRLEDWTETLEKVTELKPEHISCYSLIVEEDTAFYKLYESDKLNLPDENLERAMYHTSLEILNAKGYKQYEISNFSMKEKECRHNLIYWNMEDYIGCGSAAHSYLEGIRYSNVSKIEEYISSIEEKGMAINEKHKNSTKDEMEEFMFMGLRKINGISEKTFSERFNININKIYGETIDKHVENKLLIRDKGRICLTSKGIELSNTVMSDFII